MVICDDRRKIRAYLSGFPGYTHDNRLWKHMPQYQRPDDFFDKVEYVLGDSAFEPGNHCVPAYRSQAGYIHDKD